jgi:pilus assembly protein Flp/PilA
LQPIDLIDALAADDDGTALLEYTVLIGILLVAVIAIIAAVGSWISNEFVALTNLMPKGLVRRSFS